MRENRTFTILPVGVTEADERVLSRILKISLGSSRSYTVTSDQEPAPGKILVVNADSAAAVQNWRARYVTAEGKAMMPTVFASRQNLEGRAAYHVGLPFRATHVLSTLDQITIKELNYIPELTIGAEPIEPESPPTDSVDPSVVDPLDGIDTQLDSLADVDPAEAVAVLADITVELNKELDADTDRS